MAIVAPEHKPWNKMSRREKIAEASLAVAIGAAMAGIGYLTFLAVVSSV